ncbi:hypothetical protein [Arthrobacter sp. HLT1-21]
MGTERDDTDRVIITEVGASGDRQATHGDDGNYGEAGQRRTDDGTTRHRVTGKRSVNPFFMAAWLLALLMVVAGVSSVVFSLQGMNPYARFIPAPDGISESTSYQILMSLLISPVGAGPLLLVAGCMLAGILLTVHGVNHARRRSEPASAAQA